MHGYDDDTDRLAQAVLDYARQRLRLDPVPLDGPATPAELTAAAGPTVTADGLGGLEALRVFADHLAPACISVDHPRYLAFIPAAPTEASSLFDLVVGASSIYGGTWLEGSGAVHAENEALRWVADLAGLPAGAGGVFVPGASSGNLSALVAARHAAAQRRGGRPARWVVAGARTAHSSIQSACDVMDVDFLGADTDADGRLTGAALDAALDGAEGVFAVVATAGTTNLGVVDDLESVGRVCAERGIWYHVDGAYGGAALAVPELRPLFRGVERADSFVVDPHKWFFAPFDCAALIYRDPALALAAHTQKAGYLDVIQDKAGWNPSDLAIGLTRRARGLPFWFSLAVHGTRAYGEAVARTVEVARYAADEIRRRDHLELVHEPQLSVVTFRRVGWTPQRYADWSDRLLAEQLAFVLPTVHEGETVTRFAVVNPRTSEQDVATILDTMA